MKIRIATITLLAVLSAAIMAPSAGASSATSAAARLTQNIPVTGVVEGGGTFTGTLDLLNVDVQHHQLVAQGLLSGTLTDAAGDLIGTVTDQFVTIPLLIRRATCQILRLVIGPLDLNLLGLMVHLNRVVLTITAESGPGNLLGNLLCAIAHLLDSGGGLNQIAKILNVIIDLV